MNFGHVNAAAFHPKFKFKEVGFIPGDTYTSFYLGLVPAEPQSKRIAYLERVDLDENGNVIQRRPWPPASIDLFNRKYTAVSLKTLEPIQDFEVPEALPGTLGELHEQLLDAEPMSVMLRRREWQSDPGRRQMAVFNTKEKLILRIQVKGKGILLAGDAYHYDCLDQVANDWELVPSDLAS